MRLAARVDGNQKEVVRRLRSLGYSVLILSSQGRGCPDLLIGGNGKNYLIELKDGSKPFSQQLLTDDERIFFDRWQGQVDKCFSIEGILDIICEK